MKETGPTKIYYGITITFQCSACLLTSVDQIMVAVARPDDLVLASRTDRRRLRSKNCSAPLDSTTHISTNVRTDTPERLRELGFVNRQEE
jgi:hypothetical protein